MIPVKQRIPTSTRNIYDGNAAENPEEAEGSFISLLASRSHQVRPAQTGDRLGHVARTPRVHGCPWLRLPVSEERSISCTDGAGTSCLSHNRDWSISPTEPSPLFGSEKAPQAGPGSGGGCSWTTGTRKVRHQEPSVRSLQRRLLR